MKNAADTTFNHIGVLAVELIDTEIFKHEEVSSGKVQCPVVPTDGHASKFNPDFMHFCQEHEIFQFLSPLGTTNVT